LYGIGAVLVLLGIWAASKLFGKPKSSVRPGYRDLNDESEPSPDTVPPANEQQLLDHLAEHPDDTDASMELLRHYYVQGDATQFESVAEGLQHKLPEDSSQWAEVVAMGEDLAPHHHLFAKAHEAHEHEGAREHEHEAAHDYDAPAHSFEAAAPVASGPYETMVDKPRADLETQHFDFEDLHSHADHAEPPAPAHEPVATHAHEAEMTRVHEVVHAAPAVHHAQEDEVDHEAAATEFFTGEDTISTRLDLARAYLDMGDPEGARSMLDEVLAEGNAAQKEEARKLLAEIR
jgi:pilus assembly protein FimV